MTFDTLKVRMLIPTIIFEDDALVAFDKPSGLSVVFAKGSKREPSLMDYVHEHMGKTVANVHRLDTEASGLVLCAKTKPGLDFLSGQFQSKTVDASYRAVCSLAPPDKVVDMKHALRSADGLLPEAFDIELALDEDELKPGLMKVAKKREGKPSLSQVRVLEAFGPWVWLECKPVTARPHQLRVHLSAIGAAVLNDHVYGDPEVKLLLSDLKRRYKGRDDEKPMIGRLALHCSSLTFNHPVLRTPMTLEAPLPHEFEIALKYLRKFSPTGSGAMAARRFQK